MAGFAAGASPFAMLAMQGMVPGAPPPPVFRRLLMPFPALELGAAHHPHQPHHHRDNDLRPQHVAAAGGGDQQQQQQAFDAEEEEEEDQAVEAGGGRRSSSGASHSPARGAAQGQAQQLKPGRAPAPLPMPDASVHLRVRA